MKDLKILFVLPLLLVISIILEKQNNTISTGDIAFVSYTSKKNDTFSIIALKDLKPNTIIYFTDSEWNGSRFGKDENSLTWDSGNKKINFGTIIEFKTLNKIPKSSHGLTKGQIKLNKKGDAIYAFTGLGLKNPTKFITAISNDKKEFGTLINTNLKLGETAIILPKGTYRANFVGVLRESKKEIIADLNNINNYEINKFYNSNFANK